MRFTYDSQSNYVSLITALINDNKVQYDESTINSKRSSCRIILYLI